MIQRAECLYKGNIVGIESIYQVINGKNIKLEHKVEEFREKARNNELYCTCGCGSKLTIVAGNEKVPHFRIKNNENSSCFFCSSGHVSISNRILLKCWLEDIVGAEDIELGVSACSVGDTNRKYEFSFVSRSKNVAVAYWNTINKFADEKIEILDDNRDKLCVFHVMSDKNHVTGGQYPENAKKIQNVQGYCLFMEENVIEYDLVQMQAVFYVQRANGLWEAKILAEGRLKDFILNNENNIFFRGESIKDKLEETKNQFAEEYEQELLAIEKEKEELEEERLRKDEELKNLSELASRKMPTDTKSDSNLQAVPVATPKINSEVFNRQDKPFIDGLGNRWVRCKYCGKIATADKFVTYGGVGSVNMGICYTCNKKPEVEEDMRKGPEKNNSMVCPRCGGKLVDRNGPFGKFIGCSNYPKCKFTKNI